MASLLAMGRGDVTSGVCLACWSEGDQEVMNGWVLWLQNQEFGEFRIGMGSSCSCRFFKPE